MNRVLSSIAGLSLVFAGAVSAQVNEKAGQSPGDAAALQSALQGGASTSGSLVGGPTYDRIFTGDVNNGCAATSTFSGAGVGVEYALIPIYSPTGGGLVASLDNPGTDIGDTVLSLYCDPFDDSDASVNLVAYNDDFTGLISAFDGSEGIVLAPDTQYFLVVSLFSPADIGGGNYELTIGGASAGEEVLFGSPPPPLPAVGVPVNSPIALTVLVLLMAGLAFVGIRRIV
ncbi:MAG: hypothetical protein AAGJ52_08545 [Pseudomonadota bacterium]